MSKYHPNTFPFNSQQTPLQKGAEQVILDMYEVKGLSQINIAVRRKSKEHHILVGSMVLMLGFIKRFNIIERINERAGKGGNHHKANTGLLAAALMVAIFTGTYTSLLQMEQRVDLVLIANLLGVEDQKEFDGLKRLSLSDALKRVNESHPEELYQEVALEVLKELKIIVEEVHLDSTARGTFRRDMPAQDMPDASESEEDSSAEDDAIEQLKRLIRITFGKSKDGRILPQLMQYGFTEAFSGISFYQKMADGNSSDYTNFPKMLEDLTKSFDETFLGNLRYACADSAAYSPKFFAMAVQNNIHAVTRIPDGYKVAKDVLHDTEIEFEPIYTDADRNAICDTPMGAWIDLPPMIVNNDETNEEIVIPQKGLLVINPALRKTKRPSLQKKAEQNLTTAKRLIRERFSCHADAVGQLKKTLSKLKFIKFSQLENGDPVITVSENITHNRGRKPKDPEKLKNYEKVERTYFFDGVVEIDQEAIERALISETKFLIVTTDVDRNWKMYELLEMYRRNSSVENLWRITKSTKMFLSSLQLKDPSRVEGICWLLNFCVLAYLFIQHKIRVALEDFKNKGIDLHIPRRSKGITQYRFTTESLINYLDDSIDRLTLVRPRGRDYAYMSGGDEIQAAYLSILGKEWIEFMSTEYVISYNDFDIKRVY